MRWKHEGGLFSGQVPHAAPAPRVEVRREMLLDGKIKLGKESLDYKEAHSEDDRAWRTSFVKQQWGHALDSKDYVLCLHSLGCV